MDQTVDAIVQAADEALSIVIIGVGNADFSNMEVLDGDDAIVWKLYNCLYNNRNLFSTFLKLSVFRPESGIETVKLRLETLCNLFLSQNL